VPTDSVVLWAGTPTITRVRGRFRATTGRLQATRITITTTEGKPSMNELLKRRYEELVRQIARTFEQFTSEIVDDLQKWISEARRLAAQLRRSFERDLQFWYLYTD